MTSFPEAARVELANVQLRTNLRNATDTIREKRAKVVEVLPDWEQLRDAGKAIKTDVSPTSRSTCCSSRRRSR